MIPWHRLFGLTLTDFFLNTPYKVELEKDLSLKQQLLDVVIIEKQDAEQREAIKPEQLPDGLENLSAHNLITYKSHRETLESWTVEELIGHYVNYRKQISSSFKELLPEKDFRLYAVSTRYPEKLAQQVKFKNTSKGIYDVKWGTREIRIIVLSRISNSQRNAPWLMFSAVPEKVVIGTGVYKWNSPVSTVMNQLYKKYKIEGVVMPYTIEDYQRDMKEDVLKSLTKEDIDKFLKRLSPEDRLKGLTPDEIEAYLRKIRGKTVS